MLLWYKKLLWLCLKLSFILELHETSFNVIKRKIVSRISRYVYMSMFTCSSEITFNRGRYIGYSVSLVSVCESDSKHKMKILLNEKIKKNRKIVFSYVSEHCASLGTKKKDHFWRRVCVVFSRGQGRGFLLGRKWITSHHEAVSAWLCSATYPRK